MRRAEDVPLTEEGRARLREELWSLQSRRSIKVSEHEALLTEGEGSDAPAADLRHQIALLERRIARLREALARAWAGDQQTGEPDVAGLGSRVTLRWEDGDEEQYTLVGPLEADVSEGRLSHASPIGQALLGRRKGEQVEVRTPGGPRRLLLLAVA
ncbi:MAG: GreA/GreB family elongation factor [Dehalococcoidales bacterium]|nr:GreA/GreB family elongation factor [Dehalococcoidales bacterium]